MACLRSFLNNGKYFESTPENEGDGRRELQILFKYNVFIID
jgi:hypothetical protein